MPVPQTAKAEAAKAAPLRVREIGDAESRGILRDCRLGEATVMQSFAFSSDASAIYTIQLVAGGKKLPGEPAALSARERAERGDLCLTKLDASGAIIGTMYCLGFGHGVQMGVEPGEGGDWLWTETAAVSDGSNGWGSRLARFRFVDGAMLDGSTASPGGPGTELAVFAPIPGADRTTANVDPASGRLVMRYRRNGFFRYAVYGLEAAARGDFSAPLADLAQPACLGTFQGYALFGDSLYLLDGDTKESSPGSVPGGDVFITRVKLATPEAFERRHVSAGLDLGFREPEGMSLCRGQAGTELVFGFASYEAAGRSAKAADFFGCSPF
jgi:hypothetical protein